MTPTLRDTAERLFWTFVSAFLGTFLGAPVLLAVLDAVNTGGPINLSLVATALVAATFGGVIAVANAVLLIARWRLSVLPDPGQAVRVEAATEAYRQIEAND